MEGEPSIMGHFGEYVEGDMSDAGFVRQAPYPEKYTLQYYVLCRQQLKPFILGGVADARHAQLTPDEDETTGLPIRYYDTGLTWSPALKASSGLR